MSFWYEPDYEDIDITEDGKEVHVYLGSDESGNIYASIKTKDLETILKKYGRNRKSTRAR